MWKMQIDSQKSKHVTFTLGTENYILGSNKGAQVPYDDSVKAKIFKFIQIGSKTLAKYISYNIYFPTTLAIATFYYKNQVGGNLDVRYSTLGLCHCKE